MQQHLKDKYEHLLAYLRRFKQIGVACSGGVDSTLLAYACCEALGPDRVVVLFADSCLLAAEAGANVSRLVLRELPSRVRFETLAIDALAEEEFTRNDETRCYLCKRRIYTALFSRLKELGIEYLCDGTNCDDLGQDRPGLKAIAEMKVVTPLVEAGYRKTDVRQTAAAIGLPNARQPSNSCLATRIELNKTITDAGLREIESLERFLHDRGFAGCRVRPRERLVILEVRAADLPRITDPLERQAIVSFFQHNGFSSVFVDLSGRSD